MATPAPRVASRPVLGPTGPGDLGYLGAAKGLLGATDGETRQCVTDHVYGLLGYTKEARQILVTPAGASRTAANDITSTGYEAEINHHTAFWKIKLTGAKNETIDSTIAASLTRYVTARQPILAKASYTNTATGVTKSYRNTTSSGTTLTGGNSSAAQVLNGYNPLVQNAGKPRPQTEGTPWALRIVDPRLFQHTFNVERCGRFGFAVAALSAAPWPHDPTLCCD